MRNAFLAVLILFACCAVPTLAAEDRPANFIFLLDVSGSMLYKSEMVKSTDGKSVFLFEALRQALKQIASDPRLIGPKSKACVITFGSQVTEKSDWPQQLETDVQRQKLMQLIDSPVSLQADKHGDTYMGGALTMALAKANKFYADSDPCTTTFVVMLTDGWDEPPPGAQIKVRDAAAKYVARVKEVQSKLGVKTWQSLVIGLQNLPDRKAGTTTAKELAGLLDGEFIDVTKQAGDTVSEKCFRALKQTVERLKGEIKIAKSGDGSQMKDGVLQFGTVNGNGTATASFPVELRSCYAEDITGISENFAELTAQAQKTISRLASSGAAIAPRPITSLPPGAITVKLSQPGYNVTPQVNAQGERRTVMQPIGVVAQAHNNCGAGAFFGSFKIDATAKVSNSVPFLISVPGRLVSDQESIKLLVKKPGMFWAESTDATLEDSLKELAGSHARATYTVTVTPESARLVGSDSSKRDAAAEATIDVKQINHGKPLTVILDTTKSERQPFQLELFIPAHQQPGKYEGKLDISVSGSTETVAPSEIPYQIIVEPSPWEKVAPIVIPVFILGVITCVLWFFCWVKTLRR